MNEMHGNEKLNFHADAQEAKQKLDRNYASLVNRYGSYKEMPWAVKNMLKEDYNTHKAKWGENGTEAQKRFGAKEQEPEYKSLADEKEAFLAKAQQTRENNQIRSMEVER